MEDDIDIEEHDVLDNPRIRNIFPDLSIVKNEAPSDSEEPYPEEQREYSSMSIKEEYDDNFEALADFDETVEEQHYVEDELPPEEIYNFNNKIILGSKPNPEIDQQSIEQTYNLDAFVLLDDWGQHLNTSPSYCIDCRILFATPNALDAHKMTAHSFLVAVTVNKAKKSTTKGVLNYAKKSTTCVPNNEVKRANFARKSTGNATNESIDMTKFCNHCNVTFPDHTSLISHLYELLPSKEFNCSQCSEIFKNQSDLIEHTRTHVKIETAPKKPPIEGQIKFKCRVCKEGFTSYVKARYHRSKEHYKLVKFSRIIVKVINTKPASVKSDFGNERVQTNNPIKKNTTRDMATEQHSKIPISRVKTDKTPNECKNDAFKNTPVPKSVLFQCGKCQLNFLSCFVGVQHLQHCIKCEVKTRAPWQCNICTRQFRPIDKHMHKIQHKISGRFRVYKNYKSLYERILCKCPKCGVCFDELLFKYHCIRGGCQPAYKHCEKCDLLIDKRRFDKHVKKHTLKKFKRKDFVVIEYALSKDIVTGIKKIPEKRPFKKNTPIAEKVKFEPDARRETAKTKTFKYNESVKKTTFQGNADKLKLYFCKHCFCCITKSGLVPESHMNKKCKKCHVRICDECGLFFSYSSWKNHRELHTTRKFTVHDIVFYELGTTRPVRPLIPPYPKCNKCKIHFAGNKYIRVHACGEDYEVCPTCNEMYDSLAMKLHAQFHDYGKGNEGRLMPELIKKYESIQKMWHILYLCDECDITMDSYDKAVEHCQKHFSKKERDDLKVITCDKCQLNFDNSCWIKHNDLHSHLSVNTKDFCILTFVPTNLFNDDWMKLFGTLPQEQVRQILFRSLYCATRSVKMNLVQDGRPDLTIYCCERCEISVKADDINTHLQGKCCVRTSSELCLICNVPFSNHETRYEHQKLHIDGVGKDEFRIVHFNLQSDRRLNSALKLNTKRPKEIALDKKKSGKATVIVRKKTAKETHTVKKKTAKEKYIAKVDPKKFRTKVVNSKVKKLKLKKVNRKNQPRAVLYKCSNCNICLSSKYSRVSHNCVAINLQRTCEICKQQFPYQVMGKHNIMHRDNPSLSNNIKIVTFNSRNAKVQRKEEGATTDKKDRVAKIYKCDCGLHFTSLAVIEKHLEVCSPYHRIPEVSCSKCGLSFPTEYLVSHLCKHHSKDTQIVIEEIHKPVAVTSVDSVESVDVSDSVTSYAPDSSSKSRQSEVKLYKCSQCNVYFMTQATCYKHTVRHVPLDPKQYIKCKLCGLQFTIISLTRHLKRHHEKEFNLDKLLIEEYHPNSEGKKATKIDIYFAVDRVQSLLVSSSNEND